RTGHRVPAHERQPTGGSGFRDDALDADDVGNDGTFLRCGNRVDEKQTRGRWRGQDDQVPAAGLSGTTHVVDDALIESAVEGVVVIPPRESELWIGPLRGESHGTADEPEAGYHQAVERHAIELLERVSAPIPDARLPRRRCRGRSPAQ